ncbi:MAG: molybdate ABC transporter substrate-binding protein [Gemmatimonadota bacterium]|nr:molybdate ABC transporter substrate-binding protein [Gemmatimonadota bacterium]
MTVFRLTLCLFILGSTHTRLLGEPVRVYAAASLIGSMKRIEGIFERETGLEIRYSFAASSTLARQIERGAPAGVYISANPAWMDYLETRGLIRPDTRTDLLGNSLVVVVPGGEGFPIEWEKGFDFAAAFEGPLAVADPELVPAGIYAKQAFVRLGWWGNLKGRLAVGQDVRAALAFVEQGACAAGIVYATDAASSDGVDVLAVFPADTHGAIVYPVAIVKGRDSANTRRFVDFLKSAPALGQFRTYGFRVPYSGESSGAPQGTDASGVVPTFATAR